jgi:hypothetical protein
MEKQTCTAVATAVYYYVMDIEMKLSKLKQSNPNCALRSCDKYDRALKTQLSALAMQQDDIYGAVIDNIVENAVKQNCVGCKMNSA